MSLYHSGNFVQSTKDYNNKMESHTVNNKRKREAEELTKDSQKSDLSSSNKQRQPKTLFRPWSNEDDKTAAQEELPAPKQKIAKTSPKPTSNAQAAAPSVNYQTKLALPQAPVLVSPYQLAIQQQQRQTAMAMQQAVYQRQVMMAHIWARQQLQHQQMQLQHHIRQQQHHQQQQQMFMFGAQHGSQ